MKIQTMSIVVGTEACNARCPFCIAGMTPSANTLPSNPDQINWRNFHIACDCAIRAGVLTILLTGKGEPTLYPDLITTYLNTIRRWSSNRHQHFPFIELQTNGILLADEQYDDDLKVWYEFGMTTICISMVHHNSERNKEIYQPHKKNGYLDLELLITKLHSFGFSVRLSCMLVLGYIDSPASMDQLLLFCRQNRVEQLTIRPIAVPDESESTKIRNWVIDHTVEHNYLDRIYEIIRHHGHPVLELPHGATVYDVDGQNVCISNCITTNKSIEDMRQIIFFPDGRIGYDWKYRGALLI